MTTADLIRILLLLDVVGMGLMGMFYLSRRRLGWAAYLAWGILAASVPIFGPFVVIALRPGRMRINSSARTEEI